MGKLAEARIVLGGVDHLIHVVVVFRLRSNMLEQRPDEVTRRQPDPTGGRIGFLWTLMIQDEED